MSVTLSAAELRAAMRIGSTDEEVAEAARLLQFARDAIERFLGPRQYDLSPESASNEAAVRLAAYLYDMDNAPRGQRQADPFRFSGAARILEPYRIHRGAAVSQGPDRPLTFTATAAGSLNVDLAWTFSTDEAAQGSSAAYKWQWRAAERWFNIPGGFDVRSYRAANISAGPHTFQLRAANEDAFGALIESAEITVT